MINKVITNDLLTTYNQEGYVILREVLPPSLAEEAGKHVKWLLEKHPERSPETLDHDLVQDDPFWIRLISDNRLLDVAEQFIGPNIALFASHYICKPPKVGQPVLWHQDGSYWPLDPMEVITLWLAVSESTPENGCLRIISRSHNMELQEMKERSDIENVLGSGIDSQYVDESQAVDLVLKPGDVSIHHPNIVHGSEPNTSDNWRMGLTIRYIPTTTHITKDNWCSSFLLRGQAVEGINEYLPVPKYVAGRHMPFAGCEKWA